ncbi:MAG TPA: malectin [Verrucomicrobiae bacterium]|nr:malectin [Verrucomicrobiae bacterium]
MSQAKHFTLWSCGSLISALAMVLVAGCQSAREQSSSEPATATATATAAAPAATTEAAPAALPKIIRIDAGSDTNYVDAEGNTWLADQGFADGEVITRDDDMPIANTKDPALYRTEHYDMTSFSENVPNGKYTVKLHFAETYEGVTGPGERVFSFNVGGQNEFKDFDVWVKAGGPQKAYDVTVDNVDVTDGKLAITFTANVQSPEINGIEIIPAQ